MADTEKVQYATTASTSIASSVKLHPLSAADDYPSHIRFNPPQIILTPRLYLRRATEDDVPAIHRFLTQEETMKFMASKVSTSLDDSRDWYRARFIKDPITGQGGGEFIYLICFRDVDQEGEAIGTCGSRKAPQLGYQIGLGPKYWGKGYASEAVGAVVKGICQVIQKEKLDNWEQAYIRIEVHPDNIGSSKVAEKVGAKKANQRIDEDDGEIVNEYRLYVKDWADKTGSSSSN